MRFFAKRACACCHSPRSILLASSSMSACAAYRSGPLIALGKGQKAQGPAVTREAGEARIG
jgi:hypothetical protein